jgi:hypothetical protein
MGKSHTTEKSEAIAPCKEMPVILVSKVVDKKICIQKGSGWGKPFGVANPKKVKIHPKIMFRNLFENKFRG